MGWVSWIESHTGDLDTLLGYSTSRTVLIRDRWLGMGLLFIKVVILAYVIGYQLVVQQVCLRQSEIESSVRLQVQEPASSYRWRSEKTADTVYGPPYCLGTESLGGPLAESYSLGGDGTYSWKGPGADGTVLRQRACQYLDRATGVPLPDVASTFVTTETRTTPQALPEGCAGATSEACAFGPTENYTNGAVTQRAFVADPEYFTVLVDHGLNAVNVPPHGLSRTVAQMSGAMLDVNGERVDACDDYAGFAAGCPAYVKIGVKGSPDIIPIATLLRAAEAGTLDVHSTLPGSLNSKREGGIVVLLEVRALGGMAWEGKVLRLVFPAWVAVCARLHPFCFLANTPRLHTLPTRWCAPCFHPCPLGPTSPRRSPTPTTFTERRHRWQQGPLTQATSIILTLSRRWRTLSSSLRRASRRTATPQPASTSTATASASSWPPRVASASLTFKRRSST